MPHRRSSTTKRFLTFLTANKNRNSFRHVNNSSAKKTFRCRNKIVNIMHEYSICVVTLVSTFE